MLGPITVGKKAASWGYKRYGVPGAVATGTVGVAGYLAARKALRRKAGSGDDVEVGSSTETAADSSTETA